MRYLTMEQTPELQSPVAVMAFTGWNDAASAASNAARFMVRRLGARRFASIESEPFYAFTETRPSVRLDSSGQRQLTWPGNEFYYARTPGDGPDYVIGIGAEPNLRWRTFSEECMDLFRHARCLDGGVAGGPYRGSEPPPAHRRDGQRRRP